jgi:hypothetical protein
MNKIFLATGWLTWHPHIAEGSREMLSGSSCLKEPLMEEKENTGILTREEHAAVDIKVGKEVINVLLYCLAGLPLVVAAGEVVPNLRGMM